MKKILTLIASVIFAVAPAAADCWVMDLAATGGWTYENETVSVSYSFDRNVIYRSGWTISKFYNPYINVKIKNTTDGFIYLDLSKTYITRNGEAALYENRVSMSKDKNGDEQDSRISQTVMPIPPHASKTLGFALFAPESGCYDGKITFSDYQKVHECREGNSLLGDVYDYDADNSPIQSVISFAYSTQEKGEKQVTVTKDFYIDLMAAVKKGNDKTIESVLPNMDSRNWFVLGIPGYQFNKATKSKKEKSKKDSNKRVAGVLMRRS